MILLVILLIIVAIIAISSVKIVQQSESFVVERLGSFYQVWNNGVHFKIPFIDNIVGKLSLKEHVISLPSQTAITKDNVMVNIDTIMTIQVIDPKAATYGVDNLQSALERSVSTALRNAVGNLELEQTSTEHELINKDIRNYMDDVTNKWGVKVNRVEIKDVRPPQEIQEAMERQLKADRDRRAKISEAEGEKQSKILDAQAQAEKTKTEAQAKSEAEITEAKAKAKSAEIEAEGKAKAIQKVQDAYSASIKKLDESDSTDTYLRLQALETLAKMANGKATKLIVPSDLQDVTSLTNVIKESSKTNKE